MALENDTVWLTQAQIAELFNVSPQNITMHLKKIYAERELSENSTCKDFLQVQSEGGREVGRSRKHYNLDAIISVGYRVSACYQHCVLQYVLRKQMTNQSLRERFGLSESSSNTVSQIINAATDQKLIKMDPNAPDSRRYARYIPYWA